MVESEPGATSLVGLVLRDIHKWRYVKLHSEPSKVGTGDPPRCRRCMLMPAVMRVRLSQNEAGLHQAQVDDHFGALAVYHLFHIIEKQKLYDIVK